MKSFIQKHATLIFLATILIVGTGVRLYDLGQNSFVADEFLDINGSYGYAKTGVWQSWDFNYDVPATQNINVARDERATVYKWQVAQVLKVLPANEFSARLVSVFWGLISMILIFFVARYFTKSSRVALLATFFFALSISAIIFDRRLRMYAMFLPVYLGFTTLLYMALEEAYRGKMIPLKFVWEKWGINLLFLPLAIILGVLAYLTHQLALTGPIVLGVYILVVAIMSLRRGNRKNKYTLLSVLGLLGVALLFITGLWNKISYFFIFFDDHYSYLGYVFGDFAHPLMGGVLVVAGAWLLIRKAETEKQGIWLAVSLFAPLAMSIWLWHRNAGPQYIFFVQSFTFILAAVSVASIIGFIKEKFGEYRYGVVVVTLLALILVPNYGYFLEENNTYHETTSGGNPNYRKVFTYFMKQVEPGEVLITRNFRNFYWAGAKVPVYDFGGELSERNLSEDDIKNIQNEHPAGWVIVSENDLDYIKGDAKDYIEQNFEHISNSNIRGAIEAYRWPKKIKISVTSDIQAASMKMRDYDEKTPGNIIYPSAYEEPFKKFLQDGADVHIALGDNTNTCADAAYAEKLKVLTFQLNVPVLFGFGNHDCDEGYKYLSSIKNYTVDKNGVRIIVLNTEEVHFNETGQDDGGISDAQLEWFSEQLKTEKKVVVAMSKPAFRKDLITPKPGYEKFFSLVKSSPNIKHIFGGDYHVHNEVKEYLDFPGVEWHFVPALTLENHFGDYQQIEL